MKRYRVELQVEREVPAGADKAIQAAAAAALGDQGVEPPAEVTILLSDDGALRRLNSQYRGLDRPTDVLSFAFGGAIPGQGEYLGDVAISVPAARRQAAEAGHSLTAELQLLTVHAVLHLLGWDDAEPGARRRMCQAQAGILAGMGVEVSQPAEGPAE